MALPNVVTYSLNTTIATNAIASALAAGSGAFALNGTYGTAAPGGSGVLGTNQQRVTVVSSGDDSAIYFHIVGLNQAGFTVQEFIAGGLGTGLAGSAVAVQSNLDYQKIISIQPSSSSTAQTIATTAATVSAGLNGVGSTMWNIMNWNATPVNIEASAFVTTTTKAVTWRCEYTYDDPNNLPVGVQFPQPFIHPTMSGTTASLDGPINDPVTGVRFTITAGTGTIRGTIIQAGAASP